MEREKRKWERGRKESEKRERKREREGMTIKGEARGWHEFQNK